MESFLWSPALMLLLIYSRVTVMLTYSRDGHTPLPIRRLSGRLHPGRYQSLSEGQN
jgi:hypothetical protein